jgi:hypothetical protein
MDARFLVRLVVLALTALTAVAAQILAYLLDGPGLLTVLRVNLFTQFACAGPFLMYCLWAPEPQRRKALLAGCVAFLPLAAVPLGIADGLRAAGLCLVALGAVGLTCLARRALDDGDRALWRDRFLAGLYVPLATATAPFYLWLSGRINPVYDLYVFAFEDTLGLRLPILAGRLFEVMPPLALAAALSYGALSFGIAMLYAMQERARADADILVAFAVAGLLGFSLYFVFPVVGPLNVYGAAYPGSLPPFGSVIAQDFMAPIGPPRNGMPSLHTAWALLIWLNARPLAPLPRQLFRLFAALNLLATIGLPDAHWATDLIVGAPIAVATQALCGASGPVFSRSRFAIAGACLGLIAAWFAALWWGTALFVALPGLSWAAVAGTLVCLVLLVQLQQPTSRPLADAALRA